MSNRTAIFLALFMTVGFVTQAFSQTSSTVIGGGSLARECYDLSQHAAISRSASRIDVAVCDKAVFQGSLNKAELAATYSNRGVIYMAMEQLKEAYRDYNRAIEIDPLLAEAYINRGNLWFAVQKFEEAVSNYDKALELGASKNFVALLNRGLAHESLGGFLKAREDYISALAVKPEWPLAKEKLERVERKIKDSKE
jgi:tetratricopeptide (TPR) repeat protein